MTASAVIAAPSPQRACVAHEDVRRIAVVPEEADARTSHRCGQQCTLETVLTKCDGRKDQRDDGDGPCGQTIESVRQVHCVAHRHDHHTHEREVYPWHDDRDAADGEHRRYPAQIEPVGRKRNGDPRRQLAPVDDEQTEDHRDGPLPEELGRGAKAQGALVTDLRPVVDEAENPAREHRQKRENTESGRGSQHEERRRDDQQDEDATHRRSPLLDEMALGAVSANLLPDVAHPQQAESTAGTAGAALTMAMTTGKKNLIGRVAARSGSSGHHTRASGSARMRNMHARRQRGELRLGQP